MRLHFIVNISPLVYRIHHPRLLIVGEYGAEGPFHFSLHIYRIGTVRYLARILTSRGHIVANLLHSLLQLYFLVPITGIRTSVYAIVQTNANTAAGHRVPRSIMT